MRWGAVALAAGVLFAWGCRAARQPEAAQASLRIAISDDLPSLDPNRVVDTVSESVLFNVYEPLVGFDEKLGIRTLLAEFWEHPEPERWRFRLRRGVRFHDGTPLTAAIARDALLAVRGRAELEASEFLSRVSEITAVDDSTLDLVTQSPRVLLPDLPVVFVTKPNAAGPFPPSVGTGPYRIGPASRGAEIELERFEGYWGTAPEFPRVTFVSVEDPGQRPPWRPSCLQGRTSCARRASPSSTWGSTCAGARGTRCARSGSGAASTWPSIASAS
jgi:peptide/nickel transport system substrate-binding protein